MQSDPPHKPSPPWAVAIILLLAVIVLYILSTGPAVWLRDHGVITQEQLLTAYAPIAWLDQNVPFFRQALEAYLGLWAKPPPA